MHASVRKLATDVRRNAVFGPVLRLPFVLWRQTGMPIPHRVYQHLWFEGEIDVNLPTRETFRMHSYGDAIENAFYWAGVAGHEGECVEPWTYLARTARVVLDIGANTGTYSLMACAANPNVLVHAFEPVARVASKARRNAALNPRFRAKVHEMAVGAASGTAMLSDPGGDNCYSASLNPDFLSGEKSHYEVAVVTVDDFVAQEALPTVDLVKIDVEGFEEFVIDGMAHTIHRHRPALMVEYLPRAREGLRKRIEALCENDYVLFHLTPSGPRVAPEVAPSHSSKNVVLMPRDRIPARWG